MNKYNTNMSSPHQSGYLELFIGPMYASKTTRLVEIYKQCKFCNISVTVINHTIDNRYDDELLSTHDKIKIPCIKTERLSDVWVDSINIRPKLPLDERELNNIPHIQQKIKVATSDVILINEGQFFEDLYEVVVEMLKNNKKVYICGLDGDFERKKFGQILDLIPLCDKVTKLTSLCSLCKNGTPGIFSMRLTHETDQTVVGSDNYIPVCRKCYSNKNIQ
jgi:thymidine kinase